MPDPVDLGASAFWTLLTIAVLSGAASIWVFRRFSNATAVRLALSRVVAHLLEFRLFADEPRLIVRAQRNLLLANRDLLITMLPSFLVLATPSAILLAACDAFFGHAALKPGQATVVTVRVARTANAQPASLELRCPPGLTTETPPVYVPISDEVSWRLRATRSTAGNLQVIDSGRQIGKTICSKPWPNWISQERTRLSRFLLHPLEWPFTDTGLLSISVQYPTATIFRIHWLVWFTIGSLFGAMIVLLGFRPKIRPGKSRQ